MIDPDAKVRVFVNWKHGCYSIMQHGRLKASARQVRLRDVAFTVRESGRQRMLRENRRTVHAFAEGKLVDFVHPSEDRRLGDLAGRAVAYNPYECGAFVDRDTRSPVHRAPLAQFDESGAVYAPGPDTLTGRGAAASCRKAA